MYDYILPRPGRKATVLILLYAAIALTAAVCYLTLPGEPHLIRDLLFCAFFGFPMLTSINYLSRYITKYLYRLRPNEIGGAELEVYIYRRGDRMQLILRTALAGVTAVTPLTKTNAKPAAGAKRVFYGRDPFPQNAVILTIEDGEIVITPDARLLALIQQYVQGPEIFDPAKRTNENS